jgi:serine phosphatase RsbU (regulator of sigma subunit)
MNVPAVGELAPSGVATVRVLLVEDDDGDALLFGELLVDAGLGAEVVRARTVAEAVSRLPGGVSCVVLDLGLPDADGLGALVQMRAAAPAVPMLVLTGLADTARGVAAVAAGAQDYLVKGRTDGELLGRSIRYAIERQRLEGFQSELHAARLHAEENARLERGLLPRPLVADARLTVASGYRPGRARTLLGGDFYDVVELPDGTLHAIVGDVCGHDPDAAALGVCLRIAWRTLVLAGRDPADLIATLEQVLGYERHSEDVFATACLLCVAPDRRSAQLRVAGHPLPILVADGEARELRPPVIGTPLGLGELAAGHSVLHTDLPAAWELVFYTDGLIEGCVDGGPGRLGSERLVALIRDAAQRGESLATLAVIERLFATAIELNGGDLTDDVAALVIAGGSDG